MRFTVFTPTYNRAYVIGNLYRSLQRQTFRDFEWIVMDDGSTDNTEALFASFMQEENDFPIRYEKVENGGKHRAINKGVSIAEGELFYIVDSDDYLPNDALQIINNIEQTVPQERKHLFAGVCGQKGLENQGEIGQTFSGEMLDITTLERSKYQIRGDKAEVYYTSVMKKYPFPEFKGENFLTECVVWDRIGADGYLLRFFNQVVMICEYLPDGLSSKGREIFLNNPRGYGLYLHQSIQYGKLTGLSKWNELLDFYGALRDKVRFVEMASYVRMNPFALWFRFLGLRVFYKLYGRW